VLFKLLWVQQILGITAIGRFLGRKGWLPGKLGTMAAQRPASRSTRSAGGTRRSSTSVKGLLSFKAPKGTKKRRVALFTGCLADQLFADVNEATVQVLLRNGCDVDVLAAERCCGALHIHNGARDQAKELAREPT
jgi:glycolate oxidase iron-sulfur subunit